MGTLSWRTGVPTVSCNSASVKTFEFFFFFSKEGKVDLGSENDDQMDFRFAKWYVVIFLGISVNLFRVRNTFRLSKNRKLQGIPPSAFFSQAHKSIGENYIRFCFIKVSYTSSHVISTLSSQRRLRVFSFSETR